MTAERREKRLGQVGRGMEGKGRGEGQRRTRRRKRRREARGEGGEREVKSSCASHENRLSVGNKGKIPRYSADLRARQKDGGESMVIEDSCDVPPIMEITATPPPPYAKATWMFVIFG